MKKILFSLLLLVSVISSSAQASSFIDEKREGLILGIGAGFATVYTDSEGKKHRYLMDNQRNWRFGSSFKVGYGLSEQFAIYFARIMTLGGHDHNDDWYMNGLTGVAADWFIEENTPLYLTAAIGLGDWANLTKDEGTSGMALLLGGGYEIIPHVKVEINYMLTFTSGDTPVTTSTGKFTGKNDRMDIDTRAFQLMVSYELY